jgi:hypothetical protein
MSSRCRKNILQLTQNRRQKLSADLQMISFILATLISEPWNAIHDMATWLRTHGARVTACGLSRDAPGRSPLPFPAPVRKEEMEL